jgi:acetyl esterase/lipase
MAQEYLPLWPQGEMPNSKGIQLERIEERERVTQIDVPGMYAFFTSNEENSKSAVLIFPPGGYRKLTYNIAGMQLAKWLNTIGVNAFVIMYRLPASPDLVKPYLGPIQDAQRAMKIVRANAKKWGIAPDKIGVMGCSAGGHLAANLCTIKQNYSQIGDSLDNIAIMPNFQLLISAALSFTEIGHIGSKEALLGEDANDDMIRQFSNELNVTSFCPPAFIVHASDDPVVNSINSVEYYTALRKAGVESSLFIFPHGRHSIALRNNPETTNYWSNLCESWLREFGFIGLCFEFEP